MTADNRPLADAGRIETALRLFPYREMSAELYAARYSHTIGCSSFDDYRYPDPALGAWIDQLHRLLRTPGEVERCRQTLLSPEELQAVEREIAIAMEQGL